MEKVFLRVPKKKKKNVLARYNAVCSVGRGEKKVFLRVPKLHVFFRKAEKLKKEGKINGTENQSQRRPDASTTTAQWESRRVYAESLSEL